MYNRKSVGPIIEPWGTPALTGYSCEDFPFKNHSKTSHSKPLEAAYYWELFEM